ncbi:MAG: hypothetical protein E7590_08750 [Ruminococcaceae bacterium]|nr:hypothetical protein [Oscillospiraceae bacterium]
MEPKKKKTQKWTKFRHRIVRNLLFLLLVPYIKWKYHVKVERYKEQGKRPYLILMNHQTPFDQFFVGMAFRGPIYYVASEDLFSKGWVSSVIRFLVAPIPIKKQTTDVRAIMNCLKVAREGGTIAMAPEGNRTFSGKPVHMNAAVAPLARKLNMPIALLRIEGGYGVQPRWGDTVRKGKMRAYVSRVLEPEEYKSLSDEELFAEIRDGLNVDEGCVCGEFYHKRNAEYMERMVYVCPDCGLSTFESHRDIVTCKKCGKQIRYLPTKELQGVGSDFPFRFLTEWWDYQNDFVNSLDLTPLCAEPIWRETSSFSEVIPYKNKVSIEKEATVLLYGDRIVIEGKEHYEFRFDEVSAVTVLGRNKVNIYFEKRIYQLKGPKPMNALKYVNIFHRYCNQKKGDDNVRFLGL